MRARSCLGNLICDDVVLLFSRRRRFRAKISVKMAKNNTIAAKETLLLQEKEGTKSG